MLWLMLLVFAASDVMTLPEAPLERGRALTQAFYKGEVATVWAVFSDQMKKALESEEKLAAFQKQVGNQVGSEEQVIEELVETKGDHQVYVRKVRFSKAPVPVMVQWTFDTKGTVAGFFIRPVPQEAPSERLDYQTKTRLRLPFTGSWFVFWGGRTLAQNYHASTVDQRFAYDLLIMKDGRSHTGEGKRNDEYFCFDQEIVAPAKGKVVGIENGIKDNVPGVMNPERPMGNHVILDHGNGEFSFLCHLREGTVLVKQGDTVEAGTRLGRCGNSGNSSEPHLHFHLQDSAEFTKGRGLPALFDDYLSGGKPVERSEPVKGETIEPAP